MNICNANCIMCTYGRMTRPKGKMDAQLYEKVVDECGTMGIDRIILNFYGEPLLHGDIVDFVRYARRNTKARVGFDTNGMLLAEELSRSLLSEGINIVVSFHGLDRASYHTIYGVDAYDKVVANVKRMIEINEGLGNPSRIIIQTTKMDITYRDDAVVHERLLELFGGSVSHSVTSCTSIAGFSREDHRLDKKQFVRSHPCSSLLDQLAVLWNGDVTVCCTDFDGLLVIGNVKNSTLQELWNSSRHRVFQRLHLLGRYGAMPICARCDG